MKEINKEQLLNDLLSLETSFNLVANQFRELREKLDTRPTDKAVAAAARKHARELNIQQIHDSVKYHFYNRILKSEGKARADSWLYERNRVKTPEEIAQKKEEERVQRKRERDLEKAKAERKQMREEAAQRKALKEASKNLPKNLPKA